METTRLDVDISRNPLGRLGTRGGDRGRGRGGGRRGGARGRDRLTSCVNCVFVLSMKIRGIRLYNLEFKIMQCCAS